MSATSETPVTERQILLVGPYGVLGTGVVDAVAENPKWRITTAARRPPPTYRAQAAPPHISVDLIDREGKTEVFSFLDKVTDLVFAPYVEKPTMAETVEPNARISSHTPTVSINSQRNHQLFVKNLRGYFGNLKLTEIHRRMIEEYRNHRRRQPSQRNPKTTVKGATVNREI